MSWNQFYGGTNGNELSFLQPVPINSTRVAILFPQLSHLSSLYLGYLVLAEELPIGDAGGNIEVASVFQDLFYNPVAIDIDPTRSYTAYLYAPSRIALYPTYVQLFNFTPDI